MLVNKSFLLLSLMPPLILISFCFKFHNFHICKVQIPYLKEIYVSLIHLGGETILQDFHRRSKHKKVLWFTVKPMTCILLTFWYWQRITQRYWTMTVAHWATVSQRAVAICYWTPFCDAANSIAVVCLRLMQNYYHTKLWTGVDCFSSYAAWK